jgi:hypothetical protein
VAHARRLHADGKLACPRSVELHILDLERQPGLPQYCCAHHTRLLSLASYDGIVAL